MASERRIVVDGTPPVIADEVTTVIKLEAPDNQDLSGAPYDLYAPVASQVAVQPYLSGTVGPGNRIELVSLPRATYRLVVQPAGMASIELIVDVGSVDTEMVLKVGPSGDGSDGAIPVVNEREHPANPDTANRVATTVTENDAILVTGLPSTGVPATGGWWFWLLPTLALGVTSTILISVKFYYSRER